MTIENQTINVNDLMNDLVKEIKERREEISEMDMGSVKRVCQAEHDISVCILDRVLCKYLSPLQKMTFLGRLRYEYQVICDETNNS
jgi:hypothetical protein